MENMIEKADKWCDEVVSKPEGKVDSPLLSHLLPPPPFAQFTDECLSLLKHRCVCVHQYTSINPCLDRTKVVSGEVPFYCEYSSIMMKDTFLL